jgi:hypothetical protein
MEQGFVRWGKVAVLLLAGILLVLVSWGGVFAAEGNVSVTMTNPTNGTVLGGIQTFNATSVTGVNITWRYYDSGYVTVCYNTSSTTSFYNESCNLSGISDGSYNFSAWANLTSINESWSDNVTLIVDNTGPNIDFAPNNPSQSNWTNSSSVTFNVTITDDNPNVCKFQMNHSSWASAVNYTNTSSGGSCSYYFDNLGDGNWTYAAWADDDASNHNSTETRWIVVETEAPSVTVHTPGSTNQSSLPVLFNFTVVDEVALTTNCTVWFNGSQVYNNDSVLNNTPTEFNVMGLGKGEQAWEINCSDANYTYVSGNTTFGMYPNVAIEDFWWSRLPDNNTAPGDAINATVLINLTGSFNLTDNVSVRVRIGNSTWYNYTAWQNVTNTTLTTDNNSTLVNFQGITVPYPGNFTLNASITLYEPEAGDSSDNRAAAYVYAGYIVELVNVCYDGTCTYNNVNEASVPPGENITVNVSVQYPNGAYVTGLGSEDFKIYNKEGSAPSTIPWTNSSMGTVEDGGATGHYKFNFQVSEPEWYTSSSTYNYLNLPNDPGKYTLYINVTNGNYRNPAYPTDYAYYNTSAPYLTISYSIPDEVQDLESDDYTYKSADFNITISNADGTEDIKNIHIEEEESEGVLYFDFIDCGDDYNNISSITAGSTFTDCKIRIKTNAVGDDEWTNVTAIGYDDEGNMYYYSLKRTFDIEDSDADSDDGDGSTSGTTSSGGDDFNFAVSITDYPSKVYAYPGGSNKTNVTVKNSGDTVLVGKLKVTASGVIDSTTITPVSYSLSPGSSWNFTIDFTLASDVEVGEYTGIFTAYMSTDADTNDAKTFKVVVLATEELAEQINASCQNKTAMVEAMFTRFGLINPAAVNDSNYTAVKNLMDALNSTFVALLAAVDAEDWTSANTLLSTLQADMDNAETALAGLELEQTMAWGGSWSGIWFWVIIVVVMVIVVGFVAYLFYPQKKGLGFAPPTQKRGFLDRLKGGFSSAKTKTKGMKVPKIKKKEPEPETQPRYIEGYEKHGQGEFQYKKSGVKGIVKKIKDKFKKKKPQKDMSEFFSSSDKTERIVSDY